MTTFLDIKAARQFIEQAVSHYQDRQAPGWFVEWLDDLYIRIGEDWRKVTLDELATLQELREDGCWLAQSYAVNRVYKMFERIGRNTTGIMGY